MNVKWSEGPFILPVFSLNILIVVHFALNMLAFPYSTHTKNNTCNNNDVSAEVMARNQNFTLVKPCWLLESSLLLTVAQIRVWSLCLWFCE